MMKTRLGSTASTPWPLKGRSWNTLRLQGTSHLKRNSSYFSSNLPASVFMAPVERPRRSASTSTCVSICSAMNAPLLDHELREVSRLYLGICEVLIDPRYDLVPHLVLALDAAYVRIALGAQKDYEGVPYLRGLRRKLGKRGTGRKLEVYRELQVPGAGVVLEVDDERLEREYVALCARLALAAV